MTLDEAIKHCKKEVEYNKSITECKSILEKYGAESMYHSCEKRKKKFEQLAEWLEELKRYRQREEMGDTLFLPCKIGSDVYCIESFIECKHNYLLDKCPMDIKCGYCGSEEDDFICCEHQYRVPIIIHRLFNLDMLDKFGKTIFLTMKEAEKKLKEVEK